MNALLLHSYNKELSALFHKISLDIPARNCYNSIENDMFCGGE